MLQEDATSLSQNFPQKSVVANDGFISKTPQNLPLLFCQGPLLRTESPGQAPGIWRLSRCNLRRFLLRYQDHHQDPWILPDSCFWVEGLCMVVLFCHQQQSINFWFPSSRAASRLASPAPSPAPAMASPGRGVWWGWEVSLGSQLINNNL